MFARDDLSSNFNFALVISLYQELEVSERCLYASRKHHHFYYTRLAPVLALRFLQGCGMQNKSRDSHHGQLVTASESATVWHIIACRWFPEFVLELQHVLSPLAATPRLSALPKLPLNLMPAAGGDETRLSCSMLAAKTTEPAQRSRAAKPVALRGTTQSAEPDSWSLPRSAVSCRF